MSGMTSEPREKRPTLIRRLTAALGWTRASYYLLSAFIAIILLIIVVWWPLVVDYFSQISPDYPLWEQLDWLLLGIFAFMSLAIMAGTDIRRDGWIVLIGMCGGLVIEGWGTQTRIWTYFTQERPPLWIIPAWPIASLTIDRIVRFVNRRIPSSFTPAFRFLYPPIFSGFFVLMCFFVWPFLDKSLTILALISCALLILTPGDYRLATLTFLAGSTLGFFLEVWGTTRFCWTYYTFQTPPFFAVLAHGLAGFAFWRVGYLFKQILVRRFAALASTLRRKTIPTSDL
jgi:hypothetical protein